MRNLITQAERDNAMQVPCDYRRCEAAIGQPCINTHTGRPLENQVAHRVRIQAAKQAALLATARPAEVHTCDCCGRLGRQCHRYAEATAALRAQWDRDPARLKRQGWALARNPGRCADCRQPYRPGALIQSIAKCHWRAECCAHTPGATR